MFDLFTGKVAHVPSTPAISILVSTGIQGTALPLELNGPPTSFQLSVSLWFHVDDNTQKRS
jgi:hypothetical protein